MRNPLKCHGLDGNQDPASREEVPSLMERIQENLGKEVSWKNLKEKPLNRGFKRGSLKVEF